MKHGLAKHGQFFFVTPWENCTKFCLGQDIKNNFGSYLGADCGFKFFNFDDNEAFSLVKYYLKYLKENGGGGEKYG